MRVYSFNIENGGAETHTSAQQYADYVKQHNPDILVMQETWYRTKTEDMITNTGAEVAKLLGMNFHQAETPYGVGIASKYPFIRIWEGEVCGVTVLVQGRPVNVFGIHMNDWPSEHYTLRGIPYYDSPKADSVEQAVQRSWDNRKIDLLDIFHTFTDDDWKMPCIIAGDFNEPSHLDWVSQRSDLESKIVPAAWRSSVYLYGKGFKDACREQYPNPITHPEFTNDVVRVYQDSEFTGVPERIDYIYFTSDTLTCTQYVRLMTDISDHLPIFADFQMS